MMKDKAQTAPRNIQFVMNGSPLVKLFFFR